MTRLLEWQAFEYEDRKQSSDWYWAVGIIALALAVTAIIAGNLLFAIFILLASFTLLMYAARTPRLISFAIEERGLVAKDVLYPFVDIEGFDFHVHNRTKTIYLVIKSKRAVFPNITIPLADDLDPEDIKETLLPYIPEENIEPSVSEALMDYLGF